MTIYSVDFTAGHAATNGGKSTENVLRVLLIPDSIYWVTGTIARSIVKHNPWIKGTVISGAVLRRVVSQYPGLLEDIDLVHFTCSYASREWLPRLRDSLPCVTTHHHVSDWELQKHNLDGDAIMTDSLQWAEDLEKRGVESSRIVCVPPGVDTNIFVPADESTRRRHRRHFGIAEDALVVGFFGKHSSNEFNRKGIDVFLSAIRQLQRQLPSTTAFIVGPGWRDMVTELRNSGVNCIWLPYAEGHDELAKAYSTLDFYWVTARVEGGPVTLLEAMSAGVCCITTPVGLAREIVRSGENAILVPMEQAESFATQTLKLTRESDIRRNICADARATILSEMDVSMTMKRVSGLYARAFEHFCRRTGRTAWVNVQLIAQEAQAPDDHSLEGLPLHAVPGTLQRKVRQWENLHWSESLIRDHGQKREGLKLIRRTLVAHPLEGEIWRAYLRNELPSLISHPLGSLWQWSRKRRS